MLKALEAAPATPQALTLLARSLPATLAPRYEIVYHISTLEAHPQPSPPFFQAYYTLAIIDFFPGNEVLTTHRPPRLLLVNQSIESPQAAAAPGQAPPAVPAPCLPPPVGPRAPPGDLDIIDA